MKSEIFCGIKYLVIVLVVILGMIVCLLEGDDGEDGV